VTTAEAALEEFKSASGFGDALAALKDNPLPHHLTVRPALNASGPVDVESLRRYFLAFPEVEIVQLDLDWIRRLHSLLDLLKRSLLIVMTVLGLGVLAVIGNTIRLEIQQRRPEIEVTKLVGGSNAFVRRPFLYTGIFYGAHRRRRRGLPGPGREGAVRPIRRAIPYGGPGQPGGRHPRGGGRGPRLAGRPDLDRPAPSPDRTPRLRIGASGSIT
jgi:hypothetical protein